MRVLNFFNKHNVLANEQFGFRRKRSTQTAIYTLMRYIANNINNRTPSSALFLDLSKAFEFVNHSILFEKLHRYGIRGPALQWFESFLSNRKQFTRVTKFNNATNNLEVIDSKSRCVSCGVGQGTILGPLLFLVYINDLPQAITSGNCVLFADDITIVMDCKDTDTHDSVVNNTFKDVINWLDSNALKINIDKTKLIYFRSIKAKYQYFTVKHKGQCVQQIHSTKFLGIMVDEHLTWKEHVDNLCKKINKFVFALQKITNVASREIALLVYHAYVCSIIRYGILIWGYSCHMAQVFLAQKKMHTRNL